MVRSYIYKLRDVLSRPALQTSNMWSPHHTRPWPHAPVGQSVHRPSTEGNDKTSVTLSPQQLWGLGQERRKTTDPSYGLGNPLTDRRGERRRDRQVIRLFAFEAVCSTDRSRTSEATAMFLGGRSVDRGEQRQWGSA